jgi:hypothetical protein
MDFHPFAITSRPVQKPVICVKWFTMTFYACVVRPEREAHYSWSFNSSARDGVSTGK